MTRARQFLTAHEVFKRGSHNRTSLAILAAVAIHATAFALMPPFETPALASGTVITTILELPPEIVVPPPPEAIVRPAEPRLTVDAPTDDATIDVVPWDDGRWREGPPVDRGPPIETPVWIARDQDPRLLNLSEVSRELARLYPALLRDAGIGGVVVLWIFVGEDGQAQRTQVYRSSGYPAFDDTARRVAASMRFEPAQNRDQPVGVWIQIPVEFTTR